MKSFKLLALIILAFGCAENIKEQKTSDQENGPYITEMNNYRTELSENRKNGYLQLVGLEKLDAEIITFGRDSINYISNSTNDLPKRFGTFTKSGYDLNFKTIGDLTVKTKNDSTLTQIDLELDDSGNSIPLYYKSVKFMVITRNNQPYLRIWDSKNPKIEDFKGFNFYDLNKDMLFEADFTYYKNSKSEEVKSQLGPMASTEFIGEVTFMHKGEAHTLEVGNNGFTMVADATTGDETYGGGRYLYLDLPEKDGKLTLDFNRLYNPPCSFNSYTTCLYPPRQNELPFKVEAGEMLKEKS